VAREHGATEIVALLKPELEVLDNCADAYVDDLSTGIEDGTYEEGHDTLALWAGMTDLRYS
jgi:hypothetical protein